MLPSKSCNEKNCPGWALALGIGLSMILLVVLSAFNEAKADEVVVTFNRELPFKSYEFTRTFEDKESFEMWLAMRLEDKGCDPYLTDMKIQFKPRKEEI